MYQRVWIASLLMVVVGCSQRSPWRVIPAPAAAPQQQAETVPPTPAPADATAVAHLQSLLFPIAGMDSTRLDDTFDDPREGGVRKHNAIDIMAPLGTPVLSVQDGRVLRMSKSARGGIALYATDLEEQYVYYYAHLDRYHSNIYTGRPLMRGDTIGYVGTTGNSPKDAPHLHFQVMHMPANKQFWSGPPINPYPLLRATGTPTTGK